MNVHIINEQKAFLVSKMGMQEIVRAVVSFEGQQAEECSIYFVDTKTICDLHERYFNDPSPTDCISFPIDAEGEPMRVLGDVFVCPETAARYCKRHATPLFTEVTLYIVHGLLHLMGYNDIEENDRAAMKNREQQHMLHLRGLGLLECLPPS